MSRNVSVLILTFNDELVIGPCLESVRWSDDIVVVDSFSTDRTLEILEKAGGIRLYQRRFDDFSTHRNWALNELPYRHEWIFTLDSDETCTDGLRSEILRAVPDAPAGVSVFSVKRREYFLGGWISHNTASPQWVQRLTRAGKVCYRKEVHELLTFTGEQRFLDGMLNHYPIAKGISYWVERHNGYSTTEARGEFAELDPVRRSHLFSPNPFFRKEAWNNISKRIPCRWLHYLLYNIFVKWCFLDGSRGMHYTLLRTCLRYLVEVKKARLRKEASPGGPL